MSGNPYGWEKSEHSMDENRVQLEEQKLTFKRMEYRRILWV